MGRHDPRYSLVPWWLPDSDLREANGGELELERSTLRNGKPEKHIGMHVWGQADDAPSLGMIAIRGKRKGSELTEPLTICIPETPIVIERKPSMDMALLNRPRLRYAEDGA